MLLLNWGLSQARIWLDDLPDWDYEGTEINEPKKLLRNYKNVTRLYSGLSRNGGRDRALMSSW